MVLGLYHEGTRILHVLNIFIHGSQILNRSDVFIIRAWYPIKERKKNDNLLKGSVGIRVGGGWFF